MGEYETYVETGDMDESGRSAYGSTRTGRTNLPNKSEFRSRDPYSRYGVSPPAHFVI